MRALLLASIRVYQRWISPHKGFRCAYRVHTGQASCSVLGYRAVRRFGALKGLALLRQRTGRCGATHRSMRARLPASVSRQSGECDPGCDFGCDALSSCNGCDWFDGGSSNDKAKRRGKPEATGSSPAADGR